MTPRATVERFVEAINQHQVEAIAALMAAGHCFVDSLGARVETIPHFVRQG